MKRSTVATGVLCAAAWGVLAAHFAGCGDDSLSGPTENDLNAQVSFEGHSHQVTLGTERVDGRPVVVLILSGAKHTHKLFMNDRERNSVASGSEVILRRTSQNGRHTHTVILNES